MGLGDLSAVHGPLDRLPKGVNVLPYVPMNPLLGYVMGIEESKTGRMPTDEEHRRCAVC